MVGVDTQEEEWVWVRNTGFLGYNEAEGCRGRPQRGHVAHRDPEQNRDGESCSGSCWTG